MSTSPRYADGGNGTPEPQGPPTVYLPQNTPPPAYDAYVDPASAHGWQNAYDETRELQPVGEWDAPAAPEDGGPHPGVPGPAEGDGAAAGGAGGRSGARHGSGRRGRRRAVTPRSRRAVAVAGAVGAASVAALIAGFAFSGSPSGAPDGKGGRTLPSAGESGARTAPEPDGSSPAGEPAADDGAPTGPGSPRASAGGEDRKGEGAPAGGASTGPSAGTTSAPDASPVAPSATTGPGDSWPGDSGDRPGRGQGPKRPK
ncbi:hypothetical protein [Streptomyces fungicidicus]|uniref:hypothetical protein n=1 Tax=Streptomyces fungicidicus TaxID=68203 RepID=UPI00364FA12D